MEYSTVSVLYVLCKTKYSSNSFSFCLFFVEIESVKDLRAGRAKTTTSQTSLYVGGKSAKGMTKNAFGRGR